MDRLGRHIQEVAVESQDGGAFRLVVRWVEVACSEMQAERQRMEDEHQKDGADIHARLRHTEGWEISLTTIQRVPSPSPCPWPWRRS